MNNKVDDFRNMVGDSDSDERRREFRTFVRKIDDRQFARFLRDLNAEYPGDGDAALSHILTGLCQ